MGARSDVGFGALSNWEWEVNIAAVHVLLNDGKHVWVDLGCEFEDWCKLWHTLETWLGHYTLGNSLHERKVVLQGLSQDLRVNLLQVQVTNAIRVSVH